MSSPRFTLIIMLALGLSVCAAAVTPTASALQYRDDYGVYCEEWTNCHAWVHVWINEQQVV